MKIMKRHFPLYESFMDSVETIKKIIERKTKSYKDIFNVDDIKSESDDNFVLYLKFINDALEYLDINIESESKEGIKFRDFLSERFNIRNFDWSSIYLKSVLFRLAKKEKIDSDEFKEKIESIDVKPSKFSLKEFKIEDEEDIEPGNIVAWYYDIEDVTFIHYAIFLYHVDKDLVILDFNIDTEGKIKEGEIHIIQTPPERENAKFLGYYNIFEGIKKDEKETKKVIKTPEDD